MQPDCRDIKPVYEQITDGIRKMIITHAIPEGEKLPSVRELASKFAINPNAVRKAYQELEEEGYVCDREGERMAASEKQIAELLKIHPYAVKKNLPLARKYSVLRLRQAVEDLVRAEEDVKTGRLTDKMSVELMLVKYSL